jgi:hypothetical protein
MSCRSSAGAGWLDSRPAPFQLTRTMNKKWSKQPTPAPITQVICAGNQISEVLAQCRRMNCYASEPRKIGPCQYSISVGQPRDDFNRQATDTEQIFTFTPRLFR